MATRSSIRKSTQLANRPTTDVVGSRPLRALIVCCLPFLIVQVDATVMNVALGAIRADLGGGLADQQWVIDAYTLTLAAGMLTAGSLSDRIGARRMCGLGLVAFGGASVLCSLAPTVGMLIAARALQGLGAAALLPSSLALIIGMFADAGARARALGIWGGLGSLGLAAGPVLGGALITLLGWPAIFWINVPICLGCLICLRLWVPEPNHSTQHRVDIAGLLLGAVTLAALVSAVIEAGRFGLSSPPVLILFVLAVLAGVAFVAVERRGRAPMLPLSMFADRSFAAAVGVGFVFNFVLYGLILCVSLEAQHRIGPSGFRVGLVIVPMTVLVALGSTLSGRITARIGPRIPMLLGFGFAALSALLLAVLERGTGLGLLVTGATVLGLASLAMPAMTSVAMNAAGAERTNIGSGVLNTSRQTGGAVGVALLGACYGLGVAGARPMLIAMIVAVVAVALAVVLTLIATGRQPQVDAAGSAG